MFRQLSNIARFLQPAILSTQPNLIHQVNNSLRNFSILSCNIINRNAPISASYPLTSSLLQPSSCLVIADRGMKQVGRVRRRCKDCYMMIRHERVYNFCKTHPRHKQMSMVKKPKNTWILTDATQSKRRAW